MISGPLSYSPSFLLGVNIGFGRHIGSMGNLFQRIAVASQFFKLLYSSPTIAPVPDTDSAAAMLMRSSTPFQLDSPNFLYFCFIPESSKIDSSS